MKLFFSIVFLHQFFFFRILVTTYEFVAQHIFGLIQMFVFRNRLANKKLPILVR